MNSCPHHQITVTAASDV